MTSLAILTSKLEALCDEVDDSDTIPADLIERFAGAQLEHAQKCDAYVAVVKGLRHNAAYYSMRAEELSRRAKTCERVEKAIKERLMYIINANPGLNFKGTDGDKIFVCDNTTDVLKCDIPTTKRSVSNVITDISKISYEDTIAYVDLMEIAVLNTEKVRADLANGKVLPWARLERGSHLRIT